MQCVSASFFSHSGKDKQALSANSVSVMPEDWPRGTLCLFPWVRSDAQHVFG